MSKRVAENFSNNPKKQKLDDSFWDNDIDDDCFGEIASRLLEQDELAATQTTQGNHSILPTYNSFRPIAACVSTQIAPTPTIFKNSPDRGTELNKDVHMKITYLEQKCEAKEGEVTVLRAQLQKLKSEMMTQQSIKYKEYFEKMNQKEKEIQTIRGQLDFKNLEIANLKQKIAEISKANQENLKRSRVENSLTSSMLTLPNIINSPKKIFKRENVASEVETLILVEADVPLLSKFPGCFFEDSPPEVHVLESRTNQYGKNTIPHFHNQIIQEEFIVPSGPKVTIKISNKEVGLEHIYPDMLKIIKCNSEEINAKENNECIRNILTMSVQLLQHFEDYLEKLEKYYSTEDIEQMDKIFLQNNYSQHSCTFIERTQREGEIGIRAAKTVQFIAEVLPFNSYLSSFVILGKSFSVNDKSLGNNWSYLSLLCNILQKIFLLRKTEFCYGFLNSVATLLLNISRSNLYENIFPKFNDLLGLLLFSRPSTSILHKLLMNLKNCSTSINFLDFLCRKPESKKFITDKKRKLQYFNEESCKFSLFVALFNTGLNNVKDEEMLDVEVNILSSVYNIFKENPSWIYEQQKEHCICLEQLYQLTIEVSYKCMLRFWDKSHEKETYRSLFQTIIKILQLLSFNSCNLMEKFDDTHSKKYQEMCYTLLEKSPVNELSKLNISEEIPNVPSSNFDL